MRTFQDYIQVILGHEGGYVNNIHDKGGETKYGISSRAYTGLDIKNLTIEDASAIYFRDYWSKMNLDGLSNDLLKLHLFDMGVNAGTKTAIKLLQNVLGLTQDGIIGTNTIERSNKYQGNIVQAYKDARITYYTLLSHKDATQSIFLKGWLTRVEHTNFIN